jgi:ATP-dependent Clp protease, protease subunit
MNAPLKMPTPEDIEAMAALRPQASGYEAKLQKWCVDNATERTFSAVRNGDAVEISILDTIGYDFWTGGGVTSKAIKRELDANKDAKTVKVLINSPGGDVWEGIAIHSMLNRHGGNVEVEVIGLAASAASVIAMAGTSIAMHEGSMMMIHPAWTIAMGNRGDMQKTADFLSKVDASILAVYTGRTGRDGAEISAMVEAETWMTAQEAVSEKFATAVIAGKPAASKPKQRAQAQAQELPMAEPTTEQKPSAITLELDDEITPEERDVAARAAKQAVADKRETERNEFLKNHPLVCSSSRQTPPPFGGMRSK